jgi:transcriptional regulator with XRE-family HTH domain
MQDIDFVMLGNRVAAARRLRGIRQYELAERTDVHPVTLSRLEHGNLPGVTLAVIARVAMALGVSLDELLGWEPQTSSVTQLPRGKARRPRPAAPVAV